MDSLDHEHLKQTKRYLIPPKKNPPAPSSSNNPVKKELTNDDIWVENEVDYKIFETEPSIQVLSNKIQNFDSPKKSDEIRSGQLERESKSSLGNSSTGNEKEDSKAQKWIAKCDRADFKKSSKTECSVEILPNKVQVDFIGPNYSSTKTAECVIDNSDSEETEDEAVPFNEETKQLEFINCNELLCEGTESNNPFRVLFGDTCIQIPLDDSKLNRFINKINSSKNIRELSLTQMWAMLKVFEGENVVFVETPSLCSLLTFIIPMIAKTIINEKLYGPSNIIMASNIPMVAKIEKIVKYFCSHKLYVISYYGDDVDSSFEEKFAQCDFVISTPKYFMQLLEAIDPSRFSKLNTVAFDSIHSMNDISHEDMIELIRAFEKRTSQEISKKGPHIVMTSEFWNKNLERITQSTLISPILFLACPLQAAICSNIKVFLKVLEKKNHKLQLCSAILNDTSFLKRIILCSNTKEMAAIETYLQSFLNIVTVKENTVNVKIKRGKEPVTILCSEAMLPNLKIYDADCLIIFSLFSSLKDSFSVFKSHFTKESSSRCCCCIFINKKRDFELINMISNLDIEKPTLFEHTLKSAKEAYEISKLDAPFCEKLIQFGKCSMELSCTKRHILDYNRDGNKTRLNQKRVLLKIKEVYDATHYYGEVTCQFNGDQLTESDMEVFTDYRKNCRSLCHFLIFSPPIRRAICKTPEIGDQVVVRSEEADLMERGEIVEILKKDKNLVPIAVSVFTESGHIIHRNVDELYELPQKFKNLPVRFVNIILGDIIPADSSGFWSPNVTAIAWDNLIGKNPDSFHKTLFTATIKLVIGNIIVVDDIICHERRNGLELTQKFCLSEKLLASKYAINDRNISMNLIESCTKAGIKISIDSSPIAQMISEEVEIKHLPEKENTKNSYLSSINLSSYLDDDLAQTDIVSFSNFEDKERKNVPVAADALNGLDEENDNAQVAPDGSNVEETEKGAASIGISSDDNSDFDFEKCEGDSNKNMDLETLFMKVLGETLNEMKGTDELCHFLSPDVSSDDLKLENKISACEKLDLNPSTVETEAHDHKDINLMHDKTEIHEEIEMQLSKNETNPNESEI